MLSRNVQVSSRPFFLMLIFTARSDGSTMDKNAFPKWVLVRIRACFVFLPLVPHPYIIVLLNSDTVLLISLVNETEILVPALNYLSKGIIILRLFVSHNDIYALH